MARMIRIPNDESQSAIRQLVESAQTLMKGNQALTHYRADGSTLTAVRQKSGAIQINIRLSGE